MSVVEQPAGGEALERRAIWVLALAVFVLVFPSVGLSFSGGPDWWNVALFVGAEAAFVLAVGAAALVYCANLAFLPDGLRRRAPAELLAWAVALLWLGLFLTALNISIVAIDGIGGNDF